MTNQQLREEVEKTLEESKSSTFYIPIDKAKAVKGLLALITREKQAARADFAEKVKDDIRKSIRFVNEKEDEVRGGSPAHSSEIENYRGMRNGLAQGRAIAEKVLATYASEEGKCSECGGDGRDTCHNPDHGGYDARLWGKEASRLGCPVCGHDPEHKVPGGRECEHCAGTGIEPSNNQP